MKILVTGGAGYIGSHFVKYISEKGFEVTALDNLSLGHREALPKDVTLAEIDITVKSGIENFLALNKFDVIVHFAAFANVGESVEMPEMYYRNNVIGSYNLIEAARKSGVSKFVFSSTCSLYGNPLKVPISEEESVKPINPYANTKMFIEKLLADYDTAYGMKSVCLRYFNAAGADPDSAIGESHDPETHLIPIVLQAALGKREKVFIFGEDYDTPDGTCIRDYIHVTDLASAHLKAVKYLAGGKESSIINLGTGSGYSVKEIIDTARRITGKEIKAEITERRPGDPAKLVADNTKAKQVLDWKPEYGLDDVISTAWKWHSNPKY